MHHVPQPDAARLVADLADLDKALLSNAHRPTQKASHRLGGGVLAQLEAPPVTVRVLARRPSDEESELHGLYEMPERGRPIIRAWMRTAVHNRPVAFKSYLRTLLHEVAHHLDFTHFALAESFHTEGFVKREAHLARQLLAVYAPLPVEKPARRASTNANKGSAPERAQQLSLLGSPGAEGERTVAVVGQQRR